MPKVAACCIFRDEEDWLPVTIPTWVPRVDELVLVDTGSTDSSRQVALTSLGLDPWTPWNARYPLSLDSGRVLDLKLCETAWDGQASARNYASAQAFAPWVLAIDADEKLCSPLDDALRGYVAMAEALALSERIAAPAICLQINGDDGEVRSHLRVFRWVDGWKYKRRSDPVATLGKAHGRLEVHPETCHIRHLRSSVRPESIERKRRALAEMGPRDLLTGERAAHYDAILALIEKHGGRSDG
jgi:glycosyltransferase involved in cell wall biosynthesis